MIKIIVCLIRVNRLLGVYHDESYHERADQKRLAV